MKISGSATRLHAPLPNTVRPRLSIRWQAQPRNDPAMPTRVAALQALGQIGGGRVVALLASLSDVPERDLAESALNALGDIGHPDAFAPCWPACTPRRTHGDGDAAVHSLGQRGGTGVAGTLQWAAAADSDPEVSQEAIAALGRLATPEAIVALIDLTADVERREACISTLATVGETHIDDLAARVELPAAGRTPGRDRSPGADATS